MWNRWESKKFKRKTWFHVIVNEIYVFFWLRSCYTKIISKSSLIASLIINSVWVVIPSIQSTIIKTPSDTLKEVWIFHQKNLEE